MDEKLFEKGLEKRKATLGKEYVENNLAKADDFTRPFQEAMTAWCWGFGWGDETIDPNTRSMMNLSKNIVKIINLILDNYTAYSFSIKLKIICHYFYLTGMLQYLKICNRI